MDIFSAKKRSEIMSRIRSKNTKPEMVVRRLVHGMGYRFRLHRRDLPGSPDLTFQKLRKVIFVNGCFWHHHHGCRMATIPKTRVDFWATKLKSNKMRDIRNELALREFGWGVMVVWECEIRDRDALARRILEFLGNRAANPTALPCSAAIRARD